MPRNYIQGIFYDVYIIIYGTTSPATVTIYIDGNFADQTVIQPGNSVVVTINPRHIHSRYRHVIRVRATIHKMILFDHSKYIYRSYHHNQPKTSALFIQKDKPFYKPNDLVRFRCFGLENDLNVIREPFDLEISDPFHNIMAIWYNQTSRTGVISKEFQLSDQPPLGHWHIRMKQKNLNKFEPFQVGKYVLPPIKVTLSGDKYISHLGLPAFYLANRYINIIVRGRYSFGGPVKGKVILRISVNVRQKISIEKVFKFNGYLKYRFYLKEFFLTQCKSIIYRYAGMPSYISLTITARVIEEETDLDILSAPMFVNLIKAPIKIDAPYSFAMKPGMCNEITIYIKRVDGKPLTWDDVKNKLNVTFTRNNEIYSKLYCIPLDGIVTIGLPHKYFSRLTIYYYGHYQECIYTLVRDIYIRMFQAISHHYVKTTLKRSVCYAGDDINILIESTDMLKRVYYLIMKDNRFIDHGTVHMYGYFLNLNLKTSKMWIPGIKIIFTCITVHGTVLIDVMPVKLSVDFKYQVTGLYTPAKNRAGMRTTLNMASSSGSTLYIVAVDERLEFLKKPKYISNDMIANSFMRRRAFIIPYYVNSVTSLLRWCGLEWLSNRIPTYGIIRHQRRQELRFTVVDMKQPTPRPRPPRTTGSTVKVRDRFEEVWIWMEKYVGRSGFVRIPLITPDSITTWKTNVFAVHPMLGISILETPIEFLSFQEMFLMLNLPYSVIRTERLLINVIVFNYLTATQLVSVVVKSSALIFRDSARKNVKVGPKSYKSVRFSIRPTTVGDVPIELELYTKVKGRFILVDRLKKYLKVKPEGHTLYFSKEIAIDMGKRKRYKTTITIHIPSKYVIPGSERIETCLTGDIMGPAIAGLGKYVRLPRGCGEQTALNLVPNIYIYSYLKSRNALKKPLEKKLIDFTRSGYQNQLRFQKRDGSYSAFQSDRYGSVWLTAFISKSFQTVIDTGMNVYIDRNKLRLSLLWLIRKQRPAGYFNETGRVIHRGMQGGAAFGDPLTAYVVMALNSMKDLEPRRTKMAIKKAVGYLSRLNLKRMNDYTLCILLCTYAKLKKHAHFKSVERILLPRATKTSNTMFWGGTYAVEQTAYALLAYAHKKDISKGKKILNWLLSKRNSIGGYSNTQNTVVALEAMAKFALFLKQTSKADVTIKAKKGFIHRFKTITKNNLYLVQKKKVPSYVRRIHVTARGNGVVYLTVAWQYNVLFETNDKFGLTVTVSSKLGRRLIIIICFRWRHRKLPGMIVSNVMFPSGFQVHSVKCHKRACDKYKNCTRQDDCFSKTEPTKDGLNIYLNNLKYQRSIYIIIIARRIYSVDNKNTNMYITCTDYYNGGSMEVAYNPFESRFLNTGPE